METPICPVCGCEIPGRRSAGTCPTCLLRGGFGPDKENGGGDGEDPSLRAGAYRLVEPLGKGGMGEVWLAEQEQPVRRRVALKLIKPGMDTGEVLARFEAERHALARMDHPGIAKLLDAGESSEGRPFFAMELVEGAPLTEYCDARRLGTRARLELFAEVCAAVQHAHQQGVVHRDLKPSNILVSWAGAGGHRVKVIDFGIAKALGDPLGDYTLATVRGQLLGTPQYMSPEQAGAGPVDTRTDVYSLGAILYELLTGDTPLSREVLRQEAIDETLRLVREREAERPSTRLDALDAEAASRRGETADRLRRQVRGDLDWIALKALEKEASRRYQSADSFAADLRRYLNDEAVEACPPSGLYRLRKFARRNKALATATGAVAAVLVVSTAASARWAVEATAAARLAEDRLAQIDAVPEFLFESFRLPDPILPENAGRNGDAVLAVDILDHAAEKARVEFAEQPLMLARILEAIGQTYQGLGSYGKASDILSIAERASRDVATEDPEFRYRLLSLGSEAFRAQGRSSEALAASERAWREVVAADGPAGRREGRSRHTHVMNLIHAGDLERAGDLVGDVLNRPDRYTADVVRDFRDLGATLDAAHGRLEQALAHYEGEAGRRLEIGIPAGRMWYLRTLTRLQLRAGRLAEAAAWGEAMFRLCAEIYGSGHHLTAEAALILSEVYLGLGKPEAAWWLCASILAEGEAKGIEPDMLTPLRVRMAAVDDEGALASGLVPRIEAARRRLSAPSDGPADLIGIEEPELWLILSVACAAGGEPGAARRAAEACRDLTRQQLDADDLRQVPRSARLAELLVAEGRADEAEAILLTHLESSRPAAMFGSLLLDPCEQLVERLYETGAVERASRHDRRIMAVASELGEAGVERLGRSYRRLLNHLQSRGDGEETLAFQRETLAILLEALPPGHPWTFTHRLRLAEMLTGRGRADEALDVLAELADATEAAGRSGEADLRIALDRERGKSFLALGNLDEAERHLQRAWDLNHEQKNAPESRTIGLARLLQRLHLGKGDAEKALEWAARTEGRSK